MSLGFATLARILDTVSVDAGRCQGGQPPYYVPKLIPDNGDKLVLWKTKELQQTLLITLECVCVCA